MKLMEKAEDIIRMALCLGAVLLGIAQTAVSLDQSKFVEAFFFLLIAIIGIWGAVDAKKDWNKEGINK